MGEDWREFRAQLVARERLEQEMNSGTSTVADNKKEEGGIFGAITSIFKKDENKKGSDSNTQTERDVVTKAAKTKKDETSSSNIFDGVDVGGATKFSKIEVPMGCSDPFMDEEECHLIYDEPYVTLDKHVSRELSFCFLFIFMYITYTHHFPYSDGHILCFMLNQVVSLLLMRSLVECSIKLLYLLLTITRLLDLLGW